ncbi:hypothetical protein BBP40_011260 [Aspergillus hancockii]|nr:hypothetical protein BBP40_011260 [Aspergillus hancockii]
MRALWQKEDSTGRFHGEFKKPTDIQSLRQQSLQLARLFLDAQRRAPFGQGVTIDLLLQRWAVSVHGISYLDSEIGNIVGPLFAEFPVLERFSSLLPHRRRAIAAIKRFEYLLVKYVDDWARNRNPSSSLSDLKEKLVHRLVRARDRSKLSEFHYRSTLKMLAIAGREHVQLALSSAL